MSCSSKRDEGLGIALHGLSKKAEEAYLVEELCQARQQALLCLARGLMPAVVVQQVLSERQAKV